MRPDLEIGDIPMIVFMVTSVADYVGSIDPDLWRRYLAIALDGLRGQSPLPRPALSIVQATEAMSKWK